jgi:hypothetical protein
MNKAKIIKVFNIKFPIGNSPLILVLGCYDENIFDTVELLRNNENVGFWPEIFKFIFSGCNPSYVNQKFIGII